MSYRVRKESRPTSLDLDRNVWVLEGDGVCAEVWPALGFNCYRWHTVQNGAAFELLYAALTLFEEHAPTRSGFPILFPFPNRIRDGLFTWEGKEYRLPLNDSSGKNAIHGFACRRPWRVVESGADAHSAWLTGEFHGSRDATDCVALWPADYRIRVTYRLTVECLRVEAVVDNPDRVPLPFGLGYHPYFRIPFAEGTGLEPCQVDVGAHSYWELEECLPTGKRLPVDQTRDLQLSVALGERRLDDVLTDLDEFPQAKPDELLDRGCIDQGPVAVGLKCSRAFREMVVFTPPHRKAVCLEPYTCVTDAINLQQRGVDAGLRVLQPGERWEGIVQCDIA